MKFRSHYHPGHLVIPFDAPSKNEREKSRETARASERKAWKAARVALLAISSRREREYVKRVERESERKGRRVDEQQREYERERALL